MKMKWDPIADGVHKGSEYHKTTANVRTLRSLSTGKYRYQNQVWAHGDWHDLRGVYTGLERALDEARNHEIRLQRELKGWG